MIWLPRSGDFHHVFFYQVVYPVTSASVKYTPAPLALLFEMKKKHLCELGLLSLSLMASAPWFSVKISSYQYRNQSAEIRQFYDHLISTVRSALITRFVKSLSQKIGCLNVCNAVKFNWQLDIRAVKILVKWKIDRKSLNQIHEALQDLTFRLRFALWIDTHNLLKHLIINPHKVSKPYNWVNGHVLLKGSSESASGSI